MTEQAAQWSDMHKHFDFGMNSTAQASAQTAPDVVDPQWLSAIIGTIYDCVLAPEQWPATVSAIAGHFAFASAALGVLQTAPSSHKLLVHVGFDDDWIAAESAYIVDSVNLWGGPARVQAYPVDEPIIASSLRPYDEFREFAYYRDILNPRGYIDAVAIALAKNASFTGYLGLNRHVTNGDISPEQVEGLRLLAPHLRRALTISNFFDLQTIELESFRATLEGMRCAIVLVDEVLNIVSANGAAEALIADGVYLGRSGSQLSIPNQLAHQMLARAVQASAVNELQLGHKGLGTPLRVRDKPAAVMHVLPLRQSPTRRNLVARAVAAIFVVVDDSDYQPSMDAISLLYEFSPAEHQVFASIAAGRSVAELAAEMGLQQSTVRTHLHRIFEKTGCRRQAELVGLAARLSAPV